MLRLLSLAVVSGLAVAAPATAQVVPGAEYAGGHVSPGRSSVGSSEVGLRVDPAGANVAIRAVASIPCRRDGSEGAASGAGPLAPDGSFRVTLSRRTQRAVQGFRATLVAAGRIAADRVSGTLQVVSRQNGRVRCRGSVPFSARTAPALSEQPAPPPAGAVLLGRTSARAGGPFALNLRVNAAGNRIERVVVGYRVGCRSDRGLEETNYSPPMAIRPDGTFTHTERFTLRFRDADERVTVVTTGRFVDGGAIGTIRARAVARTRRGRLVERCDSGTLRWSAAP